MANHVNSYIEFIEINDAAKAKLKELVGRIRKDEGHEWFSDLFVEGDVTYEETNQYAWTTANIGPKWCYIEDMDVDCEMPFFSTVSAWSTPYEGVQKLLVILSELDPNMITTMTYEDEFPNFIGWNVFVGEECEDGCEYDDDEIREGIFDENPHLRDHWDYDEECFTEDEDGESADDEYRNIQWDWTSDTQHKDVQACLQSIDTDGNTDGD